MISGSRGFPVIALGLHRENQAGYQVVVGTKLEHLPEQCYMWITAGLPRDR